MIALAAAGREAATSGGSLDGRRLSIDVRTPSYLTLLVTPIDRHQQKCRWRFRGPKGGRRVLFLGNGAAGGRSGKGANWRGEKKAGGVPHFLRFLEESWHPAEEMDLPRGRIE